MFGAKPSQVIGDTLCIALRLEDTSEPDHRRRLLQLETTSTTLQILVAFNQDSLKYPRTNLNTHTSILLKKTPQNALVTDPLTAD